VLGGPALRLQLSSRPRGRADSDGNGERRSSLFAPHCADSNRSGESRVNSGASFTVPVGGSTPGRARGKLAAVRRAAPRPGRHPLGGSAHVLVRRGAVIHRGESWRPSAGPPQGPAAIPSGDRLTYS